MKQTPFTCIPSHGSYFECYSYAAISDEPDMVFAKRLTAEYGVATIPVSAFYKDGKDDKVIRFCFAKQEATLDKAIEKLLTINKKSRILIRLFCVIFFVQLRFH